MMRRVERGIHVTRPQHSNVPTHFERASAIHSAWLSPFTGCNLIRLVDTSEPGNIRMTVRGQKSLGQI